MLNSLICYRLARRQREIECKSDNKSMHLGLFKLEPGQVIKTQIQKLNDIAKTEQCGGKEVLSPLST